MDKRYEEVVRRFAEKDEHNGKCPHCRGSYSDWFWWPDVGRYCYPCVSQSSESTP